MTFSDFPGNVLDRKEESKCRLRIEFRSFFAFAKSNVVLRDVRLNFKKKPTVIRSNHYRQFVLSRNVLAVRKCLRRSSAVKNERFSFVAIPSLLPPVACKLSLRGATGARTFPRPSGTSITGLRYRRKFGPSKIDEFSIRSKTPFEFNTTRRSTETLFLQSHRPSRWQNQRSPPITKRLLEPYSGERT